MRATQLLPRLEPHERGRFFLTAFAFMCAATAALFSRAFGDALFLSKLGSGPLPFMYIAGALITGLGAYACARAAGRVSTARVAIVVGGLILAAVVAIYLSLDALPIASRVGAYMLADVAGRLPILIFWAYASEIFDAGQSRRLFGLLGAAGTAACLPAGLAVGPLARGAGTESLALVIAALTASFVAAFAALSRREKESPAGAPRRTLIAANALSSTHLHRTRQFVTISSLFAVTALVQTLIDFEFKAAFAPLGGSAALASIFGRLYAFTSVAALFIQLLLVHRILQWGGVLVSLCVMPGALFLAATGIVRTAGAGWVFYTKALDVTLTLTLNGTARQLLYRGIRSESRLQARAFAEGLYQPLAVGIAGAALAAGTGIVSIRTAAIATMAGCLIWLVLVRRAYASYVAGLLDSIRGRRFEADDEPFSAREPALEAYVREELASAPDEEVIYLSAIMPELGDFTGSAELRGALDRENPEVKVAILDYLRQAGLRGDASQVLSLTQHGDPEVRRAAVRCAATRGAEAGLEWLNLRLEDIDPRVRAAAAAALADTGGPAESEGGRAAIDELARSADPGERAAAAAGIEDLASGGVSAWLARLLEDPDSGVRRAALGAGRRHPDAKLVGAILASLGDPKLAAPAAEALVAVGSEAVEPLARALEDPAPGAAATKKRIPAVLERIGDPAALAPLARTIRTLTPEDRTPVARAYAAILRAQPSPGPHLGECESLIARECESAAARSAMLRALGVEEATILARAAVADLLEAHLRNAFVLLDARGGDVELAVLHAALAHATREGRSQILELMHNLIPEQHRHALMAILSAGGSGLPAASAGPPPAGPSPMDSAAEVMDALLRDGDSVWAAAGALQAAGALGIAGEAGVIEACLSSPDPVLRETALFALSRTGTAEAFARGRRMLENDPDPAVREAAASLGHGSERNA